MVQLNHSEYLDPITGSVTTTGTGYRVYNRENMGPLEFINNILVPDAISAETGSGNYRAWTEDKEGKTFLNFVTTEYQFKQDVSNNYVFSVGNDNGKSPVISFKPTYNIIPDSNGGTSDTMNISTEILDKFTNQMFSFNYGKDGSTFNLTEAAKRQTGSSQVKYFAGTGYTQKELERMAANLWLKYSKLSMKASMEILGDPNIRVGTMVSIICIMPSGIPHLSSGVYLITNVVHRISGGTYVTSLELLRNTVEVGIGKDGKVEFTVGSAKQLEGDASVDKSSNGEEPVEEDKGSTGIPTGKWGMPVRGNYSVSSEFGSRKDPITGVSGAFHNAIDLISNDVAILASDDGIVRISQWVNSYGNYCIIQHGTYWTGYAHLANLPSVRVGSKVKKGQRIGTMGTTGASTGVHLHFQLFKNGPWPTNADFINPREILKF